MGLALRVEGMLMSVVVGPGGLTKAMLDLKNVKKVISIEEAFRYKPMLEVRRRSLWCRDKDGS